MPEDVNYGAVFGEGAEAGSTQEPDEPQNLADGQGQEPDPVEEGTVEPPPNTEQGEQSTPANQLTEDLRRQVEEAASQRLEQEIGGLLAGVGILDPYTQKPVSSLEDLRAYREHFESDRKREFQEGHGMTEEQYQAYVNDLPEVKAAREAAQKAAAEGAKARLDQDLQELSKLDPQIKGLEDLAQRPEYSQLCQLVYKGLSLPQAYKLVYFDQLTDRAAQAAKQGAINSVNGKEHLQRSAARGEGAVPVPAGVAEEYRMLMPNATEAEIQAHYNAYLDAHKGSKE